MASRLPTIPRVVFTILEPLSLLAGWAGATLDQSWFIEQQLDNTVPLVHSDNSRLVALQLGNCYGLLGLCALAVLYTTTELNVIRNYLIALWIADLGHLFVCYHVMGWESFAAIGQWNAMAWGNIGATVALCLTRSAYLLGLFGADIPVVKGQKAA